MRIRWLAGPASAAAIVMLAACGSSGGGGTNSSAPAGGSGSSAGSAAGPSTATIKIKQTAAGKVLTNASGFTLYTFAADKGSTSTCYGSCAKFWPAVIGTPKLAGGFSINGHFGTTTRKDGKTQVTYDGHPLYTFAGDTKPGQTSGNGSTADGGLWKVIVDSAGGGAGTVGSTPSPAPSASSGGGGYGY